ncbi:TetR/AcrR family transcriptional regulator [Saccharomonospora azurea]|uniref:Transcriptional regulator n=1 Tax=Saccharomonospora azurea NA-128 TaxID=882081 RepID=H8GBF4_9PSEU|nr:TetR/AcrR family transcriptional regulator [Saccharomonospora azurea]EHK87600.1 transcriptional regulator, TetR family protein [Saccharomonospora azurea SZMC 14600]EHY87676.1 transcriptional regulator [Saccharomonospora azurea NA-128]
MPASSPPPNAVPDRTSTAFSPLPLHEHGRQRADAVRNRARVLDAATRVAARDGASNLTMDAVAVEASVGKGTVFRHFGDRTGLLTALLDRAERSLQEGFLGGPPPLGPGAHPRQRLIAFGSAVLRHEQEHRDLYVAAVTEPHRKFAVPAQRVRHTHVAMLVRRLDPLADHHVLGHTLLGYLDTALVNHLLGEPGTDLFRLERGWSDLVTRLFP